MNYKIMNIIVSPLAALILSPLFVGIIVKIKAFFSGKKGQPLLQNYYSLFKLLKKGVVYSKTTSWIFKVAPAIIFILNLSATIFVPLIPNDVHSIFPGDFILMLYILGLSRFFLIVSALDTGSAFEGMGSAREAFYSALVEPVVFICFITVMRLTHTTSIAVALVGSVTSGSIITIFIAIPMLMVLLAENARIPFDDPTTHLELTMIHEVMILDNSGPSLALMEYAAYIKLWLFSTILVFLTLPDFQIALPFKIIFYLILMGVLAVVIGIIESVIPRTSLHRIPKILFTGGFIAMVGFFITVTKILTMVGL